MNPVFQNMDAVILCGGRGTRLRPLISDRPKALAPFGDSTFLDILIDSLKSQGFHRFILCVGYMKDQIKNHIAERSDLSIRFSEETEPLGTGGALKKARPLIQSDTFFVLNGDSICDLDLHEFYTFHKTKNSLLSMALVRKKETGDFGSVVLNGSSGITSFKEKTGNTNTSLVNAGMYFMEKEIFAFLPDRARFSLEDDVFPDLAGGRCTGFIIDSELIDIGTPERYRMALNKIRGGI